MNARDLTVVLAALQLLPENAAQLTALKTGTAKAVASDFDGSPASADDLGAWIGAADVTRQPPLPGLQCVEIVTPEGTYRALPGTEEDEHWVVERLLTQLQSGSSLPDDLVTTMNQFGTAVLALSDSVAARGNVERNSEPNHRIDEQIAIPAAARLDVIRAAVCFKGEELDALIGEGWRTLLGPLISNWGEFSELSVEQCEEKLALSPFIAESGNGLIVAAPTSLLLALRHQLVLFALRDGERDQLAELFLLDTTSSAIESLGRLGIVMQKQPDSDTEPQFDRVEIPMLLDFDKELRLMVIADDLKDYDAHDPLAVWESGPSSEVLEERLRAIAEASLSEDPAPNEVLHIIIAQGMGRPIHRVVEPAQEMGDLRLVFSASELEVLARVDKADPILLWEFARDAAEIRGLLRLLPTSQLEEWSYWRAHGRSFSELAIDIDDPEASVALLGMARLMRIEFGLKHDPHGARLPAGPYVTVLDYLEDKRVPIFQADAAPVGSALLIVESLPVAVWIIPHEDTAAKDVAEYLVWTELIAYWLWQMGPSLNRVLEGLQDSAPIAIRLALGAVEGDDNWRVSIARPNQVLVEFPANAIDGLDGDSNDGERDLMRGILTALALLKVPVEQEGEETLGDNGIDEAIDLHMSPPTKRKLLPIIDPDPGYEPLDFPERFVSEAATMRLRREVGFEVGQRRGLKPGQVPDAEVQPLLNDAVSALFRRFESLAASLAPTMMLEWVISLNERLLHEQTLIPGQLAVAISAFGRDSAFSRRRSATASSLAGASIASRFLIEYLAACPPQGLRPASYSVYDRLLAAAELIVGFGTSSDLAKEGLAEISAVLLPTGELVDNRGEFRSGLEQFHRLSLSAESIRASTWMGEQYSSRNDWADMDHSHPPEIFSEIDPAMEAEMGHKFSELVQVLASLSNVASLGEEQVSGGASRIVYSEAVDRLHQEFDWATDKCRSVIDCFTLGPRPRFIDPPEGFERRDLWPWRFNRRLSYLRRPLVETANADDTDDPYLVFGRRQLYNTILYLDMLITHGTFEASSDALKNYMSRAQNRESRLFNEEVAAAYKRKSRRVVSNLHKIDGKRLSDGDGNDLGDIDVMVADLPSKTLLCVEAKRLAGALAPHQLRNQIDRTFSEQGKRLSHVRKHQTRIARISELKERVLARLKIEDDPANWSVNGLIVTDIEVLASFVSHVSLPVKSVDEVHEALAKGKLY